MASQSQNEGIANGNQTPNDNIGEFNTISFAIRQALSKIQTVTLVRIEKCTNTGGVSAVGFVDVTPLVNQLDGAGNAIPHVTIYNVPYMRMQGGANAIIIDPQPGDIGICGFASRDISKIKSTKKQGNPGSYRKFSFADGLYIGGVLNGTPTQYVEFSSAGIRIHSPTLVKLDAPDIQLNATTVEISGSSSITITAPNTTLNGNLNVTGTATIGGIPFASHRHTGVQTGGGNTGGPI